MTEADVTRRLWHVGRELHARVKHFFDNPPGPASTPLELLQAALDDLETRVQPAGRGSRIFPYNRVVVRIAQSGADRAAIEAVFRQLEPRLRERLAEVGCHAPDTIEPHITCDSAADGTPVLSVECFNDDDAPVRLPGKETYPPLRVTVVKGQCGATEYTFAEPVIAIGRTEEPVDAKGRVRRNRIAFLDTRDGITETVGRAHARLQRDPGTGAYHLFNEASSNPTFILRDGRSIPVPPRDPRGLRVQSGDEVQLGRAVIRLTIDESGTRER
jgi:FHA domain